MEGGFKKANILYIVVVLGLSVWIWGTVNIGCALYFALISVIIFFVKIMTNFE